MRSIHLQVIAPVLTDFFHCLHCEQFFQLADIGEQVHHAELEQYPDDVVQDAAKPAEWLFDIARRYGDQLRIQVINSQSLPGFLLSLRHWVRSYPAFIVKDRKAYIGWDRKILEHVMREYAPGLPGLAEFT